MLCALGKTLWTNELVDEKKIEFHKMKLWKKFDTPLMKRTSIPIGTMLDGYR